MKAYSGADKAIRERLGVHAFIDAIGDDVFRQKVRDVHPRTIQNALDRVRQVEADQAIEKQRVHQKEVPKEAVHAVQNEQFQSRVQDLEKELKVLRGKLDERQNVTRKHPGAGRVPRPGANRGSFGSTRGNFSRGRGFGRGQNFSRGFPWGRGFSRGGGVCYFCESPDHYIRECPQKKVWLDQKRQGQAGVSNLSAEAKPFFPTSQHLN